MAVLKSGQYGSEGKNSDLIHDDFRNAFVHFGASQIKVHLLDFFFE